MHIHGYFFARTCPASAVGELKAEGEAKIHTIAEDGASPATSNRLQWQTNLVLHTDQWPDSSSQVNYLIFMHLLSKRKHTTTSDTAFTLSLAHGIREGENNPRIFPCIFRYPKTYRFSIILLSAPPTHKNIYCLMFWISEISLLHIFSVLYFTFFTSLM